MRGSSIDVVKAYERFVRELDAKRLLALNRKATSGQSRRLRARGLHGQHRRWSSPAPARAAMSGACRCTVTARSEDAVAVGDAQDADLGQSAAVVADAGWSPPQREGETFFRSVAKTSASAEFQLWFFYPTSEYAVDVAYRSRTGPARRRGAPPGRASRVVRFARRRRLDDVPPGPSTLRRSRADQAGAIPHPAGGPASVGGRERDR